jgi:hypothetical protein
MDRYREQIEQLDSKCIGLCALRFLASHKEPDQQPARRPQELVLLDAWSHSYRTTTRLLLYKTAEFCGAAGGSDAAVLATCARDALLQ